MNPKLIMIGSLCMSLNIYAQDKEKDSPGWFSEHGYDFFFGLSMILLLYLFFSALFRPWWVARKNRKGIKTRKKGLKEWFKSLWYGREKLSFSKKKKETFITKQFDDFFPLPRKFKIDMDPRKEDEAHIKLNYHFIIEKLTRKLYYLFLTIIAVSLTFTFVLYKTSIGEQITPEPSVMIEYQDMMTNIMAVEDTLEQVQIARVDSIGLDKPVADKIKANIATKTIEYEDDLIAEVNSDFFNIYYGRYIIVRFLIAFVVIGLIRYLMVLYMRIRADRNDLIRKEEALSILFYVIDGIEEDDSKYAILRDKIPNFPLRILFDSPDGKSGKNSTSPQVISALEEMIDSQNRSDETQNKSIASIEKLIKTIADSVTPKSDTG